MNQTIPLNQELEDKLYTWKDKATKLDLYNSSGFIAAALAGITSPLAATPFAFVPAGLLAYAGITETLDVLTAFYTRSVIKKQYGNKKLANLETILELLPFATDLVPGVSIAHNIYLDDLANQGYDIKEDMYVMPKVYNVFSRIFNGFKSYHGKTTTTTPEPVFGDEDIANPYDTIEKPILIHQPIHEPAYIR